MNIIIKTGFQKVMHSIIFQPATISKGKKLIEAGHVINAEEHRSNGRSNLIKASVIRQTSVNSPPYVVILNIDDHRVISNVSCTCVYNKSNKCKHIAAVIEYINNKESLTKTDTGQEWSKLSMKQLTKEKYSKGRYFFEMYPPLKKNNVKSIPPKLEELENPSALKRILVQESKNNVDSAMALFINIAEENIPVTTEKEDCAVCLENFFNFAKDYDTYRGIYIIDEEIINFYQDYIVMSEREIIDLCCDTIKQSGCSRWFQERRLRFSSSKNIYSIKSRTKKSVESLVSDILNPKKVDVIATRYGKNHESNAIEYYKNKYEVDVKKVGVIVSKDHSWLCTSPDGVVIDDGCITKILEIKCPISCKEKVIVDFKNKKVNVNYLIFHENKLQLKKSHMYYYQCQVQMYICGVSECDLLIYTPFNNNSCLITVFRDEEWLKEVIPFCENFYFRHYLPVVKASGVVLQHVMCNIKDKVPYGKRSFTGLNIANKIQ